MNEKEPLLVDSANPDDMLHEVAVRFIESEPLSPDSFTWAKRNLAAAVVVRCSIEKPDPPAEELNATYNNAMERALADQPVSPTLDRHRSAAYSKIEWRAIKRLAAASLETQTGIPYGKLKKGDGESVRGGDPLSVLGAMATGWLVLPALSRGPQNAR